MTIKQFQELWYISQSTEYDLDKSIKMVGVVTGMTPDEVEKLPMIKFNKICARIQNSFEIFNKKLLSTKPKQYVFVNRRIYKLHYRVDKLPINAGKYVEVVTFAKDVVNNLHKIMASIAEPINWRGKPYKRDHDDIARDFEQVNFEAAYHAAVFFYTHYRVSMQLIQPYLVKELMSKGVTKEKAEGTLNDLLMYLDGCTMPKWSQISKGYLLNRFGG